MAVSMKTIAFLILWVVFIIVACADVYFSWKSYKSQVKLTEMHEKEIVEAYEELIKAHKQVQVLIRTVGRVAYDLEYMLNKMKKEG